MKKIIISLLAIVLCVMAFAQSGAQHLTFKGIPIDGTRKAFVAKLQQKGFTLIGTEEDVTMLSGDFAGYKNCTLLLTTLQNKDVVSMIVVLFPACEDWPTVEDNYLNLKSMLSEKYGNPAQSMEEFQDWTPSDDRGKYDKLSKDQCYYESLFEVENGSIELMMVYEIFSGAHVLMRYLDKINTNIVRQAAMDDL